MNQTKAVLDLTSDFKRWGKKAAELIKAGVEKYGVIFNAYWGVDSG